MTLLNIPCNMLLSWSLMIHDTPIYKQYAHAHISQYPESLLIFVILGLGYMLIFGMLDDLPLSLMLPSLLQYPLRMVAPPSPLSSPEHHKLLQHLKSLICFTFTGPEIILQDHINQAIETTPSQNVRFIHKMFIEKVRLTSFSFSLLKWAIPETKAQFSRWEDSRYWIRNNVNWIRNTGH